MKIFLNNFKKKRDVEISMLIPIYFFFLCYQNVNAQ